MSKIGFIGLGKLGLPCAYAIASKGHDVYGTDLNTDVKEYIEEKRIPYMEEGMEKLMQEHTVNFTDLDDVVDKCDIIFVPIQTPHEYKYEGCTRIPDERDDFSYEWLKKGITDLSESINLQTKDKVVIIISTVLPGTIEREIKPIIKDNPKFKLCYNPFFIAMGTTIYDFLNPEFVLFGVDDENAATIAEDFYKTLHNRPFYKTAIINAELIKVSYNTFIGMKIVFANTLMEICHKNGGDVDQVIGGLKLATDRIISTKYLRGGMGDGGGCHPRDNIAMSWLAKELNLSHNFFEDIMKAREDQTEFLADLIMEHEGPYFILGKTFKEETNLTVGSPAILLYNILKERGVEVTHVDPFVDDFDYDTELVKGTYFIATRHKFFKYLDFPEGSTVIDVWRFMGESQNDKVKYIKVGKK
ncbi:MAG: nucleotide sugar dehydrogenase [Methanobacterium sp.]